MKFAKTMFEAIREAEAKGNVKYVDFDEFAPGFKEIVAKSEIVTAMISSGDYAGAREILSGMTDMCFDSGSLTILVANFYERMQDYTQAIAILGIYMGLHLPPKYNFRGLSSPGEYFYRRMAQLLKKQGNDRSSTAMLEAGWALRKKELRRSEWEKAKQEYFA